MVFLFLLSGSYPAFAQGAFKPIIPLKIERAVDLPSVEEGYRDPSLTVPKNLQEAEFVSKQAAQVSKIYRSKTGAERGKLAKQLLQNYAKLAYYLEDQITGKSPTKFKKIQLEKDLEAARERIINLAEEYQEISTDLGEKAYGRFHLFINRILLKKAVAMNGKRLVNLLKSGKLSRELVRPVKFYLAIEDIESGKRSGVRAIRAQLRKLPAAAAVAGRLAIARFTAGINAKGVRSGKPNANYKKYLLSATNKSFSLSNKQKRAVFDFSVSVWRTAEGDEAPWTKPPLKLTRFKEYAELDAIAERDILYLWNKGQARKAIDGYASLVKKLREPNFESLVDIRILTMEEQLYKKTKVYTSYEKALMSARKRYENLLEDKELAKLRRRKAAKFMKEVTKRHRALINQNISLASSTKANAKFRSAIISLAQRYVKVIKEDAEIERVEAQIAKLHVLNKEYQPAVALYQKLAAKNKGEKRRVYLISAVNSQQILSRWPSKAPWNGIKSEQKKERQTLLKIYQDIHALNGNKVDWNVVGHIGLLHLDRGESKEGFEIWDQSIKKSPNEREANYASGIMLTAYLKAKRWQDVEALSRFARSARLKPIYAGKAINVAVLLPQSLYEGGRQALSSKQYKTAILKLREFVSKFKSKDRDHGMYLLATAYRAGNENKNAITTLINFINEYPKTRFFKQALFNGGSWSIDLALEENTMLFYKGFLRYFPNDKNVDDISETLANLYMGRRLYREAAKVLETRFKTLKIPTSKKIDSGITWMRIEEKYGDKKKSVGIANLLLKQRMPADKKAIVIASVARYYAQTRNVAQLSRLETMMRPLATNAIGQEHLGEVRFLLAESKIGPMLKSVNSHLVKEPLQAVFDRYNQFVKTQKDYQNVCTGGTSSYCMVANYRIARLGERLLELIKDFRIPETYEEKVINDFIVKKEVLEDKVASAVVNANRKVDSLTNRGYVLPTWTQYAIWHTLGDRNFKTINGDTANAYVQWVTVDN